MKIYVKGVSPRYRDEVPRAAHRRGQAARGRHVRPHGRRAPRWSGTASSTASRSPLGTYIVQAEVRDTAGNVGVTPAEFERGAVPGRPGLTVRGIAAQPPLRPVTAGRRVEFFVDARGAPYRWRVRRVGDSAVRKRGSRRPTPRARLPRARGPVRRLPARAALRPLAHDACRSWCRPQKRSSVLVVVPDDQLARHRQGRRPPVRRPPEHARRRRHGALAARVRRRRRAARPGFADDIAPLLVFLDRRRIRYDLTSDLDLDLTRNPRASDREGVLFAGSERWVTRTLSRRLRELRHRRRQRRAVRRRLDAPRRAAARAASPRTRARCCAPTQPTRDRPVRRAPRQASARRPRRSRSASSTATPSYGLMEGALDLPGFTQLEESAPVTGKGAKLLAARRPAADPEEEAAAHAVGQGPRASCGRR